MQGGKTISSPMLITQRYFFSTCVLSQVMKRCRWSDLNYTNNNIATIRTNIVVSYMQLYCICIAFVTVQVLLRSVMVVGCIFITVFFVSNVQTAERCRKNPPFGGVAAVICRTSHYFVLLLRGWIIICVVMDDRNSAEI
jgi:hypothetical protein